MHSLKITQIGNPPGVVLPKDALARFDLDQGDALHLGDAPGGHRLTTVNPECEARMTVARRTTKKRRPVPAELAG